MPNPLFRYPLDLTGINSNNLIFNEIHILPVLAKRAILPSFGPYFSESLVIRDNNTNAVLVKGIHFEQLQLVEEATIKTGKEVCEAILIIDSNVSSEINITYQSIGGLYQRTSDAILNLYNTVMNDNRPVNWPDVFNKPLEYPPSLHNHLFKDIVGFEPLIVQLERLGNAITLSNIPSIQAIIDFYSSGLTKEVIMIKPDRNIVSRLANVTVDLEAVNIKPPYTYYWTIKHIDTVEADFAVTNGIVNLKTGKADFTFSTIKPFETQPAKEFQIAIRKNSPTGQIIYTSGVIEIKPFVFNLSDYTDLLYNQSCLFSPEVDITPETMFLACDEC